MSHFPTNPHDTIQQLRRENDRLRHNLQVTEQTRHEYEDLAKLRLEEIVRLRKEQDELLSALHKYRDNVLFRIGSSSPYRVVAQEYFDYIKPILERVKGAE